MIPTIPHSLFVCFKPAWISHIYSGVSLESFWQSCFLGAKTWLPKFGIHYIYYLPDCAFERTRLGRRRSSSWIQRSWGTRPRPEPSGSCLPEWGWRPMRLTPRLRPCWRQRQPRLPLRGWPGWRWRRSRRRSRRRPPGEPAGSARPCPRRRIPPQGDLCESRRRWQDGAWDPRYQKGPADRSRQHCSKE